MSVQRISIGVREFAVPVPLKGSIELHSGYASVSQSALEVHNKFLSERKNRFRLEKKQYKTEVRLKRAFVRGAYEINVSGRLDGLLDSSPPVLEEVKTDLNIEALLKKLDTDHEHPYWLQLKLYGYLHYLECGDLPEMKLVLVSISDGRSESLSARFDLDK